MEELIIKKREALTIILSSLSSVELTARYYRPRILAILENPSDDCVLKQQTHELMAELYDNFEIFAEQVSCESKYYDTIKEDYEL